MKKLLISLVLGALLVLPFGARAQTPDELNRQVIELLTQWVAQLQEELTQLIASQKMEPENKPVVEEATSTATQPIQEVPPTPSKPVKGGVNIVPANSHA